MFILIIGDMMLIFTINSNFKKNLNYIKKNIFKDNSNMTTNL
jgi:hypothetical protein